VVPTGHVSERPEDSLVIYAEDTSAPEVAPSLPLLMSTNRKHRASRPKYRGASSSHKFWWWITGTPTREAAACPPQPARPMSAADLSVVSRRPPIKTLRHRNFPHVPRIRPAEPAGESGPEARHG
jgi:hypothetical protein